MDLVIHYNHLDRSPSLSEGPLHKYRGEGSLTLNCTKEKRKL